jgi:hypothetical protein
MRQASTSVKWSYAAVMIAAAILLAAILVAVLLPTRHCVIPLGPFLPGQGRAACSGVAELPRLVIALGGLAIAVIVLVWVAAPNRPSDLRRGSQMRSPNEPDV